MFVDTHCHLDMMSGDDADIVAEAKAAGVGALIYSSSGVDDMPRVLAAIDKFDNVFGTLGIHPEYANSVSGLPSFAVHEKIVGVGEIGLDYHYEGTDKAAQRGLFEAQLGIAKAAGLPIAVHSRDAEEDTADILKNYGGRGVMHCFTGSYGFAKKMMDRDFYFSASGIITFKNAGELRETFAKIPLDRLVVETDSPYCSPVPHRGKECRPAYVVETAKCLAEIRGLPLEEMERILFDNVCALYPKFGGALCPAS